MFRKQDKQARRFNDWMRDCHGALYRHALWMTGNKDLAAEMVQEAFFQAWSAVDSLRESDKALAWLLTILRRVIYREYRCNYRHAETVQQLALLSDEHVAGEPHHLLDIYRAMATISTGQREVFLLFHLHGFSYQEISESLNVPIGTVMSRLARAREVLQKLMVAGDDKVVNFERYKMEMTSDG